MNQVYRDDSPSVIVANQYKTMIINDILTTDKLSIEQYSIIMGYLYNLLNDGVLGINKDINGKIPFSIGELLSLDIFRIVKDIDCDCEFGSDSELVGMLYRIIGSENPIIEAYTIVSLNDDVEKGEVAKNFYDSVVLNHSTRDGREQWNAYKFLDKIKNKNLDDFRRLCNLYELDPELIGKLNFGSLEQDGWANNLESLEFVVKKLVEAREEEYVGRDLIKAKKYNKVRFLNDIIESSKMPFYSLGVIVNFVELCSSFYDSGEESVDFYDAYCEKHDLVLDADVRAGYEYYKPYYGGYSNVAEKMFKLLTETNIMHVSRDKGDDYAYDVLRTMTNQDMFGREIDEAGSYVQLAVKSRENRDKVMAKIPGIANKCFSTIEKK